jgi:hypothetical protein
LISLAQRAEARNKDIKFKACKLIEEDCKLDFNNTTGSLRLQLPVDRWKDVEHRVFKRLFIDVAEMVSPLQRVGGRNMDAAIEKILQVRADQYPMKLTAAGLTWEHEGSQQWIIRRQPHSAQSRQLVRIAFKETPGWSEWRLWDGRWWIRIYAPPQQTYEYFVVRTLEELDMKILRDIADAMAMSQELGNALKSLKGDERFMAPAIFGCRAGQENEEIIALPTAGLHLYNEEKELRIEIRFRGRENNNL